MVKTKEVGMISSEGERAKDNLESKWMKVRFEKRELVRESEDCLVNQSKVSLERGSKIFYQLVQVIGKLETQVKTDEKLRLWKNREKIEVREASFWSGEKPSKVKLESVTEGKKRRRKERKQGRNPTFCMGG